MRILCLAPHADDETLGCGGSLARYAKEGHHVVVAVVTGHGDDGPHPLWTRDAWDRVRAEAKLAMKVLGVHALMFEELPAAMLLSIPTHKRNAVVHGLIERAAPDVLFVPFAYDLHVDHREIFHAASVAWRPASALGRSIKEIYAYETSSETHWNAGGIEPGFVPNVWFDISKTIEIKIRALECYASQLKEFPDARSVRAVDALARFRGSQMGFEAAEAFALVRKRSDCEGEQ
jgi:LmbE family N-acetylglucosaminyl deacetylase